MSIHKFGLPTLVFINLQQKNWGYYEHKHSEIIYLPPTIRLTSREMLYCFPL